MSAQLALADGRQKGADFVFFARGQELDAAIGQVPHGAGDIEPLRYLPDGITKADALDVPFVERPGWKRSRCRKIDAARSSRQSPRARLWFGFECRRREVRIRQLFWRRDKTRIVRVEIKSAASRLIHGQRAGMGRLNRGGSEQRGRGGSDCFAGDITSQPRLHDLNLAVAEGRPDYLDRGILGQPEIRVAAGLRAVAKKGGGINRDREEPGSFGRAMRGFVGALAACEQSQGAGQRCGSSTRGRHAGY